MVGIIITTDIITIIINIVFHYIDDNIEALRL